MIILDTNVVSEPLRPSADPSVRAWLDQQIVETLFLTTISLAELQCGVAALPDGTRRTGLEKAFHGRIRALFGDRILPFDETAAGAYAVIRSRAKTAGRAIAAADGYIAATAAARGFAVATRDVAPFEAAGVTVVNPLDFTAPD
ncbi:MAG: type II toxin-antitoxin system VapC family toxin [Rhizobiaceae bacterium]|nr:type II toxin-antitoxin system VapC family toxin [Rhizobiaceae bacterium]